MNDIAYIDLSTQQVTIRPIPEKIRRLFLGGRGVNMYILYNHVEKGVDPLSPENVLLFGPGLLTGVHAIATARYNVSGKSPASGLIGDSNAGGFFGPELRFAGFDHLVVTGKAKTPTYLWVHDGQIEFRDASHLEEYTLPKTFEALREEIGDPDIQIAAIGPGGRKEVVFANVMTSPSNANGHTGMGGVMGSKNLWAVVARGTQALPVKYPPESVKCTNNV